MRTLSACFTGTLSLVALTFFLFSGRNEQPFAGIDPPGVVQIDAQLWMDRSEMSNFCWLEYMAWANGVYGTSSPEYTATLPDTSVWQTENDTQLEAHYLRHPAYRDYPVVGLTYRQMTAYCQWRSDRVFEYLLVKSGKIAFDAHPTIENRFTTEKYLSGTYRNYTPDPEVTVIPHYYLPDQREWLKAEAYAQAVYDKLSPRERKKSPDVYYATLHQSEPVQPVAPTDNYLVNNGLYNLHRNVSEQLSDSTLAAGENWKQGRVLQEAETTTLQLGASVTTGFRCAFEWKTIR